MDVVGSEIGQKMRSAIKAKLTELGCYVDDELPDYVMVMVANKRTRAQMEEDLQLFLGDNTDQFVNWLHQVLRKLQEVTVTAPLAASKPTECAENTIVKARSTSKDRKVKEKKDKSKEKKKKTDGGTKKSKKKLKEKHHRKKGEKKIHKSKKKSKDKDKAPELIRPNVPPLLMNMEKESEPSITDIFAGQILKNHGVLLEITKEEPKAVDVKPDIAEIRRPILPIIDPATITSQPEISEVTETNQEDNGEVVEVVREESTVKVTMAAPREEQIKEINEIEAKIQGLRHKLAEQLDSMSDDEDFLNIRTEAEELMNDFAEDVFQEITAARPPGVASPPLSVEDSPTANPAPPAPSAAPPTAPPQPEVLPQIELNLPRRSVRERLGVRDEKKEKETKKEERKERERKKSPERYTPDREPDFWPKSSAKSRLGDQPDTHKRPLPEDAEKHESLSSKRLTSRVSVLESRPHRPGPASVVRVRPRPRAAAPATNLLFRAVADAQRSIHSMQTKPDPENKIKRALVLPMRRTVDATKIVVRVDQPASREPSDCEIDFDTESLHELDSDCDNKSSKATSRDTEYVPAAITKKIVNTNYVPSARHDRDRETRMVDESLVVETINIHKTTKEKEKEKEKGPTFVVTLDGLDPNVFLAKKLKTEGLLDDGDEIKTKPPKPKALTTEPTKTVLETEEPEIVTAHVEKKRLSDTSEDSDTQVIIKPTEPEPITEKRKDDSDMIVEDMPSRKRRASPIVFDMGRREMEERKRERTESGGSDNNQVTVTTSASSHKYDAVPPLSQAERKLLPCRSFPACRFGAACAFAHPPCRFHTACTRRHCPYTHPPAQPSKSVVPSHVVPAANFKSITATPIPNMCKYYPSCVNPACHYYHPKPCRYGKSCANKPECNFYHHDMAASKWRVA